MILDLPISMIMASSKQAIVPLTKTNYNANGFLDSQLNWKRT
jgi:hypothetical protein